MLLWFHKGNKRKTMTVMIVVLNKSKTACNSANSSISIRNRILILISLLRQVSLTIKEKKTKMPIHQTVVKVIWVSYSIPNKQSNRLRDTRNSISKSRQDTSWGSSQFFFSCKKKINGQWFLFAIYKGYKFEFIKALI